MSGTKKTTTKPRVQFILCEDVREEPRKKLTLLGVYPGDQIVVVPGAKQARPSGAVAALERLAVVGIFKDGGGETQPVRIELIGPDGKILTQGALGNVTLRQDVSSTFIFQVNQFLVPEFGTYIARFRVGRQKYDFNFDILEASDSLATTVST